MRALHSARLRCLQYHLRTETAAATRSSSRRWVTGNRWSVSCPGPAPQAPTGRGNCG